MNQFGRPNLKQFLSLDMEKEMKQSAWLIAHKDGDVLFAQRSETCSSPGTWNFPGGKIDPGETPEQALVREVREEIGAEIYENELRYVTTIGNNIYFDIPRIPEHHLTEETSAFCYRLPENLHKKTKLFIDPQPFVLCTPTI